MLDFGLVSKVVFSIASCHLGKQNRRSKSFLEFSGQWYLAVMIIL